MPLKKDTFKYISLEFYLAYAKKEGHGNVKRFKNCVCEIRYLFAILAEEDKSLKMSEN